MKKIAIFILLIMVATFFTIEANSRLSTTFEYKVNAGDKRDYIYLISKENGVSTDLRGRQYSVKVTSMQTSLTMSGASHTYPNIQISFWNGTVLSGLTSTKEIIQVPSDIDLASITSVQDYKNEYNNEFSNGVENAVMDGTNITLQISIADSQNMTGIYDLQTGWMISLHTISYTRTGNTTNIVGESLLQDLNFNKSGQNSIPFSDFFIFAIPVLILSKKILKKKPKN